MPVFRLLLAVCFIATFMALVLILTWHLAIPLILIGCLYYLYDWGRAKWQAYLDKRQSNGCTIRPVSDDGTNHTIIDVDYTELN